ncbi:MAG: hypothetical protein CBB68_09315 [Rhodospirillaceae bacterium TMED8]|mgnify:CR=1 FL=1|nr:hypothetical protein [Magnetovibrio sp.]OUT50061.1 MAG: hypothetical protein CBB68_09315 [Rhodospirillaceae bacterium TMED8]
MEKKQPNELTALEALSQIHSGHLTSQGLMEACLERIYKREQTVGAWQFIEPKLCMAAARDSDNSRRTGQLRGIPVAVKDVFNTVDMPTTYGSPIYKNHTPHADATTVAMVRASGGIILGKTVTTEFAYFHPGKTANPHDVTRTPGGSSSGSAAAVADFMTPLALGTQTVGSTIRPASYCGIVGYKPSFGLIDRTGVRPLADVFDTVGLFSRDVNDVAYFAAFLSRRPSLQLNDSTGTPPKIALCHTPEWSSAEPDSREALCTAAKLASNAGADVVQITLPDIFAQVSASQATIVDFQAAMSATYEQTFHRDLVSKIYLAHAEVGRACSPENYAHAHTILRSAQIEFERVLEGVDVLMIPSSCGEAPVGLQSTGDPIFNRLGTALHLPCISVPGLLGSSGMPVGIQLLGRRDNDKRLLIAGKWVFNVIRP